MRCCLRFQSLSSDSPLPVLLLLSSISRSYLLFSLLTGLPSVIYGVANCIKTVMCALRPPSFQPLVYSPLVTHHLAIVCCMSWWTGNTLSSGESSFYVFGYLEQSGVGLVLAIVVNGRFLHLL